MNGKNDKIIFWIVLLLAFPACLYALLTNWHEDHFTVISLAFMNLICLFLILYTVSRMKSVIFKGCRYSLPMFPYPVKTDGFDRTIAFDSSCAYQVKPSDQKDWNKLTGFTIGFTGVHKNSLRIAWRYNVTTELIELIPYAYVNGVRTYDESKLVTTGVNSTVNIRIVKAEKGYNVFIVTNRESHPFYIPCKQSKYGWLCFPYFGGTSKAPRKIIISIQK